MLSHTESRGFKVSFSVIKDDKAYPSPVGMPCRVNGYLRVFFGRNAQFYPSPLVSGFPSAASRTLPLPRLIQIYKNFRNLWGRVWGKNAPHTKKRPTISRKALNFLGVPKGIKFYDDFGCYYTRLDNIFKRHTRKYTHI